MPFPPCGKVISRGADSALLWASCQSASSGKLRLIFFSYEMRGDGLNVLLRLNAGTQENTRPANRSRIKIFFMPRHFAAIVPQNVSKILKLVLLSVERFCDSDGSGYPGIASTRSNPG